MTATAPPPGGTAEPRPKVQRKSGRVGLYTLLGVAAVVVILLGTGYATHWYGLAPASSSSTGCPTGTTLQGSGASFPSALVSQWTTEYDAASSNFVNYEASGAGAGITALTDKQVDFALTDEPLNSTETTALTAAVGTVLTLPVTGGAVSLIYNIPGYSGPLNLTAAEIVGIYNGTSGYTAWDDSAFVTNNPGLSAVTASVYPVHRSDQAGMSYVLTDYLSEGSTWWATNVGTSIQPAFPAAANEIGASGNSAMIKDVSGQAGALGYTDLYDAEEHKISTASIENPSSAYIAPSVAATRSAVNYIYNASPSSFPPSDGDWSAVSFVNAAGAGDYPLATIVYAMVPENPGAGHTASASDAQVLVQWLHWVLTTGETFNQTAFPFVNPPAGLVSAALSGLSTMNYNKAAIPSCA